MPALVLGKARQGETVRIRRPLLRLVKWLRRALAKTRGPIEVFVGKPALGHNS